MPKTPSIGLDQNGSDKFIDRYFGRVPKFIHLIPEQNICEVNEDYIDLLIGFIEGTIHKSNISNELYREVVDFIDRAMCNPCILVGEEIPLNRVFQVRLHEAQNGLPKSTVEACPNGQNILNCNDVVCCNLILSCDEPQVCLTP